MKKALFTLFAFLLMVFNIYGQEALKKGVYTLGGSIQGNYSKSTYDQGEYESKDFWFSPSFGYFIMDKLILNAYIDFDYYETKSTSTYSRSYSYIDRYLSLSVGGRYYFGDHGFIPFAGAKIGFTKWLGEDPNTIRGTIEGGFNYFLSKSVALEPFVNYTYSKTNNEGEKNNSFGIGIRVNYFILN